ncbi:MAG: branched-chain amino acid ABC transporter permease [Desulfobacterales bacterium]|jgi:branched-chain amino acid transport system permease protein|nr:branched-chain amino acid ABC transporter permease [Desulfobacterales bacterium]
MMRNYSLPLLIAALFALLMTLFATHFLSGYMQQVIRYMCINVMLAASLNLVNGYMGEFSCGHGGFMAVGAYVSSVLSVLLFAESKYFGAPLLSPSLAVYLFPAILLIGAVCAALAGLLVAIPSFRTRGDYLAIITIAAIFIIITLIVNLDFIGGPRGFMGMTQVVRAMEKEFNIPWMLLWIYSGMILTLWLLRRFVDSTLGKGVMAVCQDETAAEMMSVNTNRMKLVAFMISSGLAGLAGGLFAHDYGYINPNAFGIMKSTECMVMVYLGGMGSLSGAVLAAVLFTLLLESLRGLQILKWVIVPFMLIILMQFRPEGIMGNRELSDLFPKLKRFYRFK